MGSSKPPERGLRGWHMLLRSIIASKCDNSLFICNSKTHKIFVLVYVDDILVIGNSSQSISSLITALNCEFALLDLGQVNYFIGVEVKRIVEGWLHLCQSKYIKDLLTKAKMQSAKGVSSPMTPGQKMLSYGNSPLANLQMYRSIVEDLHMLRSPGHN